MRCGSTVLSGRLLIKVRFCANSTSSSMPCSSRRRGKLFSTGSPASCASRVKSSWNESCERSTLRDDATRKVERSQLSFQEDFTRLAHEAGLPVENNFPRLRLLQGIELEVEFAQKRTLINSRPLKTVDPQRIMRAVLALKRRLYDRPFEPQGFIDGLYTVYHKVTNGAEGDAAPIQAIYVEYTLALQPRS